MKPTLWHYTCMHGHGALGDTGELLPLADLEPRRVLLLPEPFRVMTTLVWLTDLDVPDAAGLGLTSIVVACDRTRYRYRVTDDTDCVRYTTVRRDLPPRVAELLERSGRTLPAHWWVSRRPVPVMYDPVRRPARTD